MKKKKIKEAMHSKKGNMIWCCNFSYNHGSASPCKYLACPFKDNQVRLGKPGELKECRSFWITKHTDRFESGIPVLVHPDVK